MNVFHTIIILLIRYDHDISAISHLVHVCVYSARKESAKEKQLKEEEKILESVAEGRGKIIMLSSHADLL